MLPTPAPHGFCDCSGFVSWALGTSRKTSNPDYVHMNGGWIETTAVWHDIGSKHALFSPLAELRPGAVLVYPDSDGHQGHIAIVVDQGTIVHCSMGNDKHFHDAIWSTPPIVFSNTPATRIGWFNAIT